MTVMLSESIPVSLKKSVAPSRLSNDTKSQFSGFIVFVTAFFTSIHSISGLLDAFCVTLCAPEIVIVPSLFTSVLRVMYLMFLLVLALFFRRYLGWQLSRGYP